MYSQLRKQLRRIKCRLIHLRHGLSNLDSTVYIGRNCSINKCFMAEEYVYIGTGSHIWADVSIGRYSMIGPNVTFTGDDHHYDKAGVPMIFSGRPPLRKTTIGKDVWIGANAIILSGITVGDGAIVAAGTVVSRDIPACEIHGGVPNQKIKDRFVNNEDKEAHLERIRAAIIHGQFAVNRT